MINNKIKLNYNDYISYKEDYISSYGYTRWINGREPLVNNFNYLVNRAGVSYLNKVQASDLQEAVYRLLEES